MKNILNNDLKLRWVLFALAFLIYANTIGHGFAWDDSIVITENPRIKKGMSGIPDLFIKYNSQYKSDKYGYRPIVLMSYAIEYSLFKDNPLPGHFTNVLSFSLLVLVLFQLLRKLFPNYKNSFAFLVCLLFLSHPVHTEVVANIKSRDEIFGLLFSLLAIGQFLEYQQLQKIKQLIYVVLLFMLAYLSKESAIVFLGIVPLTMLQQSEKFNLKKNTPILVTILGLMAVSFLILKLYTSSQYGIESSSGAGIYYENGILGNSFFYTSVLSGKLANACCLLLLYLKNFFYPVTQLYYYGYNQIPVANWQQLSVIISAILHLIFIGIGILFYKKNKVLSFGIFFYFISISIYLHIFRTLADTLADRFLFTPSLGLCVITVVVFGTIFKLNFEKQSLHDIFYSSKNTATNAFQRSFRSIFFGMLILLSIKTISRNKVWKNDETLVTHDMPQLENCSRAHNYYADILQRKLINNSNPQLEENIIKHYKRSIEISKESYYAYAGLGNYYKNNKKYDLAIPILDTMCQLFPNQADPHYYLGDTYLQINNFSQAEYHLKKSIELAPNVLSTYLSLARTYSNLGKFDKGIELMNTAKAKFGASSSIAEILGIIYFEKGDMELSTKNTFEMIQYGIDAQMIYKIVIGRYQFKKQDSMAAVYYKEGLAKGIFR